MAEKLQPIEELPGYYADIAAGFRDASSMLARQSAKSMAHGILPTNIFFRSNEITTRVGVTREQEQLFFWFLRQKNAPETVMDVKVSFRIRVSNNEFDLPALSASSILHYAVIPPFFDVSVSPSDMAAAAKRLDVKLAEILFLQLDAGVLAVTAPEDVDRARMAWQRSPGGEWELSVDRFMPPRTWNIPPFLALARTIGKWTRTGAEKGVARPVQLPAAPDDGAEKTALYVLRQLCAAWVGAVNKLDGRGESAAVPDPLIDAFEHAYDIASFEADVKLRLDENGQLARKGDGDDLFLLTANLRLNEDESGVPSSRIVIAPPDFLTAGPLYDKFLDTLEEDENAADLADELGLRNSGPAVRDFVRSARQSKTDAPLVFRVQQGKRDTDLITLHGVLNGMLQHVVLEAEFEVQTGDDPQVSLHRRSLQALYTDRPRGGRPPAERGIELITYFLRLLRHLRDWRNSMR